MSSSTASSLSLWPGHPHRSDGSISRRVGPQKPRLHTKKKRVWQGHLHGQGSPTQGFVVSEPEHVSVFLPSILPPQPQSIHRLLDATQRKKAGDWCRGELEDKTTLKRRIQDVTFCSCLAAAWCLLEVGERVSYLGTRLDLRWRPSGW